MNYNILLIDDDEDEKLIFEEALSYIKKPFQCFYAGSAEIALQMLDNLSPGFVFIDLNMPRQDGLCCLREIQKKQKVKNASVFLYSTGLTDETCDSALKLGATSCIKKPATIDTLVEILKKVFHV